ncbi:DUF3084 domain-containing protein [Microseira sp. BLCC-F43]|jgi:uncharacterized protein (DUF3084 family)|uniref:DUF3084 domain-containing protein n=1 Tax=Microseira sp. BLCC-F43 TaxID=3153602 RepID=UPI0035BA1824
MTTGWILIAAILVLGGAIASVGDRVGTKVGKSRLSLFNLRPRKTAILITVLTGSLISASTLAILFGTSEQLRTGVFKLEKIQKNLRNARKELEKTKTQKSQVETELTQAKSQQAEAQQKLDATNQSLQSTLVKLSEATANQARTETQLKQTQGQLNNNNNQLNQTQGKLNQTQNELNQTQGQLNAVSAQVMALRDERQKLIDQRDQLQAERQNLIEQRNQLQAERQNLIGQRNQLQAERSTLIEQRDKLQAERQNLLGQRNQLQAERQNLLGQRNQLQAERQDLLGQRNQLQAERQDLLGQRDQLQAERQDLLGQRDQLQQERSALVGQRDRLKNEIGNFKSQIAQRDQEIAAQDQAIAQLDQTISQRDQVIAQRETSLKQLESQQKELENKQANLQRAVKILEEYYQDYQALRGGNLVLFRNQVLVTGVVRIVDPKAARQAVDQLLVTANKVAIENTRPGDKNFNQQVIQISPKEVDQIIDRIDDGRDYAIRILSAGNYIRGESTVQVFADVTPNRIVFQAGEVVAATSTNPSTMTQEQLEQRIEQLIAASQFRVRRAGVLADKIQIGDARVETLMRFIEQLKQSETPVDVQVVASDVTYTAGPVKMDLVAVQKGQILFRTSPDS